MREIKFRGKRFDGKWVYGFYCRWQTRHCIAEFPYESGFNGGDIISYEIAGWYEVDPETVGQFIGIKDKNGKEIYEGDIVKTDTIYAMEIYWMGIAWGFRWDGEYGLDEQIIDFDGDAEINKRTKQFKYLEIIGNVHENGLLMKEKK